VFAATTGTDRKQAVPGATTCFQIPREDKVVTEVISNTTDMPRIADSRCSQTGTVIAITASQLFGKMHGITHGAAIAARVDSIAILQRFDKHGSSPVYGFQVERIGNKAV